MGGLQEEREGVREKGGGSGGRVAAGICRLVLQFWVRQGSVVVAMLRG